MNKTLSRILLETRTSKGYSKTKMGVELGVSSQLYGQYERGEVAPKLDFRKKFKEIFAVDLIDF